MKQKHWQVSVFDKTSEIVRDDTFYVTDTKGYLVFELIDEDFTPDSASITVYNTYGKVTIHVTSMEVVDGIARYEIPVEAIRHSGDWRTQVVFTKDNEDYTTEVIEFDVGGHLLDNKKTPIVYIDNWNHFIKNARDLIYDWKQLENIRQLNETQRELTESARQNEFETNETERQNEFETKETGRQNEFETNETGRQNEFEERYGQLDKLVTTYYDTTIKTVEQADDIETIHNNYGEHSIVYSYISSGTGFPLNESGILITDLSQYQYGFINQTYRVKNQGIEFKRRYRDDLQWSRWTGPETILINEDFGSIPANSAKQVEIPFLGANRWDIVNVNPYYPPANGVVWSAYPADDVIYIRFLNGSNTEQNIDSHPWRITLFKGR